MSSLKLLRNSKRSINTHTQVQLLKGYISEWNNSTSNTGISTTRNIYTKQEQKNNISLSVDRRGECKREERFFSTSSSINIANSIHSNKKTCQNDKISKKIIHTKFGEKIQTPFLSYQGNFVDFGCSKKYKNSYVHSYNTYNTGDHHYFPSFALSRYFSTASVAAIESSSSSTTTKDSGDKTAKKVPKKSPKLKDPVSIFEAIELVKKNAQTKPRKFDETIDIAIVLGVDTRKANQTVRAVQDLPHGSGKKVRVGVFAKNEDAEAVKNMGLGDNVIVGSDDLVKSIQGGEINFDRCVSTPDCMPLVGRVARILGPRGLMPNPKLGTVTKDVVGAIKSALAGQVQFKADKFGMIHCPVGKVSFTEEALAENIRALMIGISNAKPEASKGKYIRKVHLSSTMGSGVPVDLTTVDPGSSRFFFKEKSE